MVQDDHAAFGCYGHPEEVEELRRHRAVPVDPIGLAEQVVAVNNGDPASALSPGAFTTDNPPPDVCPTPASPTGRYRTRTCDFFLVREAL